jgi:hypothetical protein
MLLKSIIWLLLGWISVASANAQSPGVLFSDSERTTGLEQFDYANIQDRWIVTSIEVDGELTAAQFGQRVGDEISISSDPTGGISIT